VPITRIITRSISRVAVTIAVLLSSIACTTQASAQNADNTRPNIVIILSDDAGYADFGFTGGTVVPTPNIDAIANEGATLTQFYTTASVCSPSRAGFLTGRYQQRFGHHSNLTGEASRAGLGLPTSERTVADHLKARGYRTGIIGKWHLGRTEELLPTSRGFDHFEGLPGGSRTYFPIEGEDEVRTMRREQRDVDGEASSTILDEQALDAQIEDEGGTGFYVTDWIGDRAANYIKSHAGGDEPYFLFVSFTAPHTPMEARPTDLNASEGIEPERRRVYAAMMRSLDRAVGEITAALDETGSADNTLVMFFNDNGGATNNGSDNGRYRGMKGSKWEGGVRVPAAVRWPGRIAPGTRFTPVVSSMDFTATAVALAGGPVAGAAPFDGRSLFPALTDTTGDALPDNAIHPVLFWERGPAAAVRAGPWKLITTPARDPLLYHIPADPSETTDLAAERPDMVDGLMRLLADWRAEMVAPLWTEGERWERNQRLKHDPDVVGREAERRYP
jgi:arylsulfatase A-like enzyme